MIPNITPTAHVHADDLGGPRQPLLRVQHLQKHFPLKRKGLTGPRPAVRAVDRVKGVGGPALGGGIIRCPWANNCLPNRSLSYSPNGKRMIRRSLCIPPVPRAIQRVSSIHTGLCPWLFAAIH